MAKEDEENEIKMEKEEEKLASSIQFCIQLINVPIDSFILINRKVSLVIILQLMRKFFKCAAQKIHIYRQVIQRLRQFEVEHRFIIDIALAHQF